MTRVVIDTNVVLPVIVRSSPLHLIYATIVDERLEWLISTAIYLEYLEQVGERSSTATASLLRDTLRFTASVTAVEPSYRWRLVSGDPDDDKFVDCAVAGDADYLVTDDRHYGRLRDVPFPRLPVVTGRQFLDVLSHR